MGSEGGADIAVVRRAVGQVSIVVVHDQGFDGRSRVSGIQVVKSVPAEGQHGPGGEELPRRIQPDAEAHVPPDPGEDFAAVVIARCKRRTLAGVHTSIGRDVAQDCSWSVEVPTNQGIILDQDCKAIAKSLTKSTLQVLILGQA